MDNALDPKLLEMLVCPVTRGRLRYDQELQELISDKAGLAYPIRDGIPILLADEARHLEEETVPRHRRADRKPGA
ncbi:MAG: Trm112 family protein [Alphaproteobacteria bacterium]|nr:MAG: Trm112 family protein [Alphaproteobacteria bacterium]